MHPLIRYFESVHNTPLSYEQISTETAHEVEILSYKLIFQTGLGDQLVSPALWHHDVSIYRPENANTVGRAALLVVSNGVNSPEERSTDHNAASLIDVVRRTSIPVIWLTYVPNQELTFLDDNLCRVEDFSIAKSWRLFMDNPVAATSLTLPLHLTMAGVVIKTMDLACEQLATIKSNEFILTGASKRGWAVWLATLADQRIVSIVPFVADFLATKEIVARTQLSLAGNWPLAFIPYFVEGIIQDRHSRSFDTLMMLVDPTRYSGTQLAARLEIPKYWISASGDDFFWPDNLSVALEKCPEVARNLTVRVVPNCDHTGVRALVEESLVPFIRRFQSGTPMPRIERRRDASTASGWTLLLSELPESVVLWAANNPRLRDFRKSASVVYHSMEISPVEDSADKICYRLPLLHPLQQGWSANFAEAWFDDGFCVTTGVTIEPEGYPSAPLSVTDRVRNHLFSEDQLADAACITRRKALGCDLQKWAQEVLVREQNSATRSGMHAADASINRLAAEMNTMAGQDKCSDGQGCVDLDILLSLKGAGFLLRSGLRLTHFGGFLLHRAASLHPLSTG